MRLLSAIALLLAFTGFLYLSSPGEVVVDHQGEISGFLNTARAQLQGSKFWTEQLSKAKQALELARTAPNRNAERVAKLNASLENAKQRMEEFHKKYPKTKPSAAAEQAEALRERADDIEQAELDEFIETARLKRMSELEEVIRVIESRKP